MKNLYGLRAKKDKLVRELNGLYGTRSQMAALAAKGSKADQANLHLIEAGIKSAVSKIEKLYREMEETPDPFVLRDPYGFEARKATQN